MWNSLTTCYIIRPEFFDNPKIMKLKVITEGYEQGSIVQDPSGRVVSVILDIRNLDQFYDYVLGQMRQ